MRIFSLLILLLLSIAVYGQENDQQLEGKISFKNSKNVYVRFESTSSITTGDTLYIEISGDLRPLLLVKQLSSISCVTTPLTKDHLEVNQKVIFKKRLTKSDIEILNPKITVDEPRRLTVEETINHHSNIDHEQEETGRPSKLRGRLSLGSYTNFSDSPTSTLQRMRYTFSLDATNINHSRFSLESYVMFRHTAHEWSEVQDNLASALKVYNLALHFEPDENSELIFGRKVNRNVSNVGAMDGLQASLTLGSITLGTMVGTRPDPFDYSVNLKMLQYGGYVSFQQRNEHGGQHQTSIAILEQKYLSRTDRRFVYFQHTNSLVNKLNLFTSVEMDLFKLENDEANSTMSPTSIFVSLNYRPSPKLSLATSYDARKNVIYYETYKNFIDQLIEQETRQGARFRVNYRPFRFVTFGSSVGYRFQKDQANTSKNLYSFLSFTRIPWVKMSATISNTLLESNYLKGNIYGIRLSRDLLDGKLFTDLNFRRVNYEYGQSGTRLKQNIASVNLTGRITKKLSISVNYEASVEKHRTLNRIYSNIIQRF